MAALDAGKRSIASRRSFADTQDDRKGPLRSRQTLQNESRSKPLRPSACRRRPPARLGRRQAEARAAARAGEGGQTWCAPHLAARRKSTADWASRRSSASATREVATGSTRNSTEAAD